MDMGSTLLAMEENIRDTGKQVYTLKVELW